MDATLTGNLVKDAEVRETEKAKVLNFTVAKNDSYKDANGEWQKTTQYIECSKWFKKDAEVKQAVVLTKGVCVEVSGDAYATAYVSKETDKDGNAIAKAVQNLKVEGRIKLHWSAKKEEDISSEAITESLDQA